MKYRAVAVGVSIEGHPVQVLANKYAPVIAAARELAKTYRCKVEIWKSEEVYVETIEAGEAK